VPAVLVDAGAIIALLDRDDDHHESCIQALKGLHEPLATVWPALTEAMHLLGDTPRARAILCDMVSDGALELLILTASDFVRIKELLDKYRDLPMDFADAALVRVAGRDGMARIVSFDKHFDVYRLPRRGRFVVLPSRS
jgi:uncharacterized protein